MVKDNLVHRRVGRKKKIKIVIVDWGKGFAHKTKKKIKGYCQMPPTNLVALFPLHHYRQPQRPLKQQDFVVTFSSRQGSNKHRAYFHRSLKRAL